MGVGGFCGGPYPDVDKSLRALAGAAEGFGHAAVGGLNGKLYYVTSLEGGFSSMHHPPAVYPICSILPVAQMDPSDCSILQLHHIWLIFLLFVVSVLLCGLFF